MSSEKHTRQPFLYYFVLILFMGLSFLFWLFVLSMILPKNGKETVVVKNPGTIVSPIPEDYTSLIGKRGAIDEEFIQIDSAANRKIVSNLVNIAVKNKGISILDFARDFKNTYPSEEYEIVYLDSTINRLQIKLPEAKRNPFKKEVKVKMDGYQLLVWDETLFETSVYGTNDPFLKKQEYRWYLDEIQVENAWKKTKGSGEVIIAVIDNGFDLNHPELVGKSRNAYNVTEQNDNVSPSRQNHGTHVAATALGNGNNNSGLLGVCPECLLMPIKIEDRNGFISSSYVIDGILYAIKKGADVVNLSLGVQIPLGTLIPEPLQEDMIKTEGKDEEAFWKELFDFATERNTICVIAAGNSTLLTGIDPFTRSEKTIKVGALDKGVNRAVFSNYGEYTTIFAPGVDIMSAKPNNGYEPLEGTSMAAPVVSGFIGLIKSVQKNITFEETTKILFANSDSKKQIKTLKIKSLN